MTTTKLYTYIYIYIYIYIYKIKTAKHATGLKPKIIYIYGEYGEKVFSCKLFQKVKLSKKFDS